MANFPTAIGATNISMRLRRAISVASSPFTYSQQVYKHQGSQWEMEITLPPLRYTESREVEAFLLKLNGQSQTFFAGNPLHTSSAVVTLTALASVRDTSIQCQGSEVFPGTYFQIGDHLYMCTDYFTGSGAMQIEPPMRESLSATNGVDYGLVTDVDVSFEDYGWVFESDEETIDYGAVTDSDSRPLNFLNPRGLWRMASSDAGWTTDAASIQSFTFSCVEAL